MTEPRLGNEETPSIKCFLCQGQWTGTSKEELATHLEEDHKVLFGIKEIMEQGENQEEVITETEPEIPAPKGERKLKMSHVKDIILIKRRTRKR